MEYVVLTSSTIDGLAEAVAIYIARGWQPQGGVSWATDGQACYLQAMIKRLRLSARTADAANPMPLTREIRTARRF